MTPIYGERWREREVEREEKVMEEMRDCLVGPQERERDRER